MPLDSMADELMAFGIYVEHREVHDGDLHIEYETTRDGDGVPRREAGRICQYLREADWEPRTVHGWVFDTDGNERGSWHAKAGWFEALERDLISETDFSTLLISSIR